MLSRINTDGKGMEKQHEAFKVLVRPEACAGFDKTKEGQILFLAAVEKALNLRRTSHKLEVVPPGR